VIYQFRLARQTKRLQAWTPGNDPCQVNLKSNPNNLKFLLRKSPQIARKKIPLKQAFAEFFRRALSKRRLPFTLPAPLGSILGNRTDSDPPSPFKLKTRAQDRQIRLTCDIYINQVCSEETLVG